LIPYYLLEIDKFDQACMSYSTPSQLGLNNVTDRTASVSFKMKDNQVISGFVKYDLKCEIQQNQRGRAYGRDEIFDRFILIQEKVFYYSSPCNILIVSSSKEVFGNFAKYFSQTNANSPLKIKKVTVDFPHIISNQNSLGIEGVWLGDYPDINIDSMYLIGNRIENSTQYQQLIAKGAKIKNITILYNYNNATEKIMITKEGGIIFYRQIDETDALLLAEDIYTKLLSKTV
jgi:hypothetical protein